MEEKLELIEGELLVASKICRAQKFMCCLDRELAEKLRMHLLCVGLY